MFNPVYPAYTPPPLAATPTNTLSHTGVYLQDQVSIGRWIVVLGLRHDDAKNRLAGSPDEKSSATSRRAGMMYKLPNGLVPYVSYSESFTPVSGTDRLGERFEPLRGEQLETGVKWEAPGGKLAFNAAYYDLKEKNQLADDPVNPSFSVQVGETHAHGLELELVGRIAPRTDIRQMDGFKAGLGMRHFGGYTDGDAPETPAVTLFDGMLGLSRGDCWFGARRTAIASAAHRF